MSENLVRTVTYYLGAGASFNSLPVVSELKESIDKFIKNFNIDTWKEDEFAIKLISDLTWLSKLQERYFSIDTAAKVFFHQSGIRGEDLLRLKEIASLYFILEQIEGVEQKFSSSKKQCIDSRYFRLLAYFLGSDHRNTLPPNLNFISWNYDMQLELAFNHFFNAPEYGSAAENLNSLPRDGSSLHRDAAIDKAKVVHLNGVAGLLFNSEHRNETLINLYDRINPKNIETIFQSLKSLLEDQKYSSDFVFSFAWENNSINKKYFQRALNIMEQTEDLVIIGYSFPNFNRSIDKQLINAFEKNNKAQKKIYFQDGNKDLAKAMQIQFELNTPVTPYYNLDEFFIPPYV